MNPPLVACLTVTNRPEWAKFCEWQVGKQTFENKVHAVIATIEANDRRIPQMRSEALLHWPDAEYLAWFDDDDWSSPDRLAYAVAMMEANPRLSAVGNIRSWFISTTTRKAIEYQAPEGLVFNGAVFRRSHVPSEFAHGLTVGEDTEWLSRYMRSFPTYLVRGSPASAWLCHGKNVTNKLGTRSFEQTPPELMTEKDWGLVP